MKSYVGIILVLFLLTAMPVLGQSDSKVQAPPIALSEQPPGDAATMAHRTALFLVRDLMPKRSLYLTGSFSGQWMTDGSLHVASDALTFKFTKNVFLSVKEHPVTIAFKDLEYANWRPEKYQKETHFLAYFPKSMKLPMSDLFFLWKTEEEARQFSNAINRLIYDAHRGYTLATFEDEFNAGAKKWRENPASRPKPPEGWDKYRILAEQRIQENKFDEAAWQYDLGLSEFPYWPEGWFNAALIYGELKQYSEAADRMKHYLILMPDAPDAKAAREKIIIWEDKAKKGT